MDRLFVAPTFLCAASQAAAIRAGLYGESGRRVLLITNNAAIPELGTALDGTPGFATIAAAFDEVVSLNELIWPEHPRYWRPTREVAAEFRTRLWERTGLAAGTGLSMQSVGVPPSVTLARVLAESPIDVVSDGLMTYGPIRSQPDDAVRARFDRLLYLDLVEGLAPLMFSEDGIVPQAIATEAFRSLMEEYAAAHPGADQIRGLADESTAMVVGQYLASLGLMSVDEEERLYREMVEAAEQLGYRRILFKPHPSAPPAHVDAVVGAARARGVRVDVNTLPAPVEVFYSLARPGLVIGSFSTALSTAARIYGINTLSAGSAEVAMALPHHSDSNRIPLLLTALTTRRIVEGPSGSVEVARPLEHDLEVAVNALAVTMQPRRFADRYPWAKAYAEYAESDPGLRPFFASETMPAPPGLSGIWRRGLSLASRICNVLQARLGGRLRMVWLAFTMRVPTPLGRSVPRTPPVEPPR